MNEVRIEYKSDNGYTGVIYGKSSMCIYDPEGRMVIHTGRRAGDDINWLKGVTDCYPWRPVSYYLNEVENDNLLVFTTTTAEAMAIQCATFLKEYCDQLNGNCSQCIFGKRCGDMDIGCPLAKLPDTWEVKDES